MRLRLWLLGPFALALLVWAASAGAAFHLMHVNEVGLSAAGNGDAQFVEFADPSDEAFPDAGAPYKLVVFDASAAKLGDQQISTQLLRDKGTAPILISTAAADAALATTGDAVLAVKLPAAGQVCFTSGTAESKVHCVSYGCLTNSSGAAPRDGQSLQRQADEKWHHAAPTPKAANTAGAATAPCPGTATPTPTPVETAVPDTIKPRLTVVLPKKPKITTFVRSGYKLGVTATERGPVSVEVRLGTRVIATRKGRDSPATLKVKPSRREGRKLLKRASAKLRLKFSATDAAGNVGTLTRSLTLRG